MNCAKVTITNGGSGFTGPDVFVANLAAVNNVKTVLGSDVVYPDPGSSVEFGGDGKTAPPVGVAAVAVPAAGSGSGSGAGSGAGSGSGAGGSGASAAPIVGGPTTMKTIAIAGAAASSTGTPKKSCGRKRRV